MQMRFGQRAVERLQAKVQADSDQVTLERQDLTEDPKAFFARVRAQMRLVVQALSRREYAEVLEHIRLPEGFEPESALAPQEPQALSEAEPDPHSWEPERGAWTTQQISEAIRPFYDDYEAILFNGEARANHNTVVTLEGPRHWAVRQILIDDQGDRSWYVQGEINLIDQETPAGPLVTLTAIRSH